MASAALTLTPHFDPAVVVLNAVARDGTTVFAGVPTMYAALLQHPSDADVTSLRMCISGGASLPVEILNGFERRFGCTVLEGFGMSEASPVVSFNHPGRERKAGSIGTPIAGVEVRLLDTLGRQVATGEVGELVVRGPNLLKDCWNPPAETVAAIPDGWLRTGDLARQDEDGYLYIVDRKKDLITPAATTSNRARSRRCCTSTPRSPWPPRRRPGPAAGRGGRRRRDPQSGRLRHAARAEGIRSGSQPTSTRAWSGPSTPCPPGPAGKM
jgi:acyl-CoA synthetase (AMP-forming)/AMP-acid ligase II